MKLGQFYTPSVFSKILVSHMMSDNAENILDIGCGQASLLNAARLRWKNAKLIGYDIDPINYTVKGCNLHINFGNGLDPDLSKKINDEFGNIDISLSNPPYISVEITNGISKILKTSGIADCIPKTQKKIPAEIIFLAQNLLVLKKGGELGAILPSSIISGEKWKGLREFLITEKSLNKVIQFPSKAFFKTETSTFAINLKNCPSEKKEIAIMSTESSELIHIDKSSAIKRLDFTYHSKLNAPVELKGLEHGVSFFRGNKSSRELRSSKNEFIHTSDLKEVFQILELPSIKYSANVKTAKKGDILISRVGSRCVGRSAFIAQGCLEVSDCITVISGSKIESYLDYFKSGLFFDAAISKVLGTGAKYLTFDIIKEVLKENEF